MACAINTCPDPTEPGSFFCGRHRAQGERQLRVIELAEERCTRAAADVANAVHNILVADESLDRERGRLRRLTDTYRAASDEVLRLIDRSGRP